MFHFVHQTVGKQRISFDPLADPSSVFSSDLKLDDSKQEEEQELDLKQDRIQSIDVSSSNKRKTEDPFRKMFVKRWKPFERSVSLCLVDSKTRRSSLIDDQQNKNKKRLFFGEEDQVYDRRKRLSHQTLEERTQDIYDKLKSCDVRSELVYLSNLKMRLSCLFKDIQTDLDSWSNKLDSVSKKLQ